MDTNLETLRAALAEGATFEQRVAGIAACRAILFALEAKPGEPLSPAPPSPAPHPLTTLPIDQILELVIVKLRSMLPADRASSAPPGEPPLTIRMFRGGGHVAP